MTALELYETLNIQSNDEKLTKFIFLWMGYNKWYNATYPKLNDTNAAIKLGENKRAITVYNTLKDDFINRFKTIPHKPGDTCERDKLYADTTKQRIVCYNTRCGKDTLSDYLCVIYQIRCNFLHWSKSGDDTDIKILHWAYDTFEQFINTLKAKGLDILQ